MSIKALLNNQTIQLDNHHRGDGLPLKWGNELHLHKRTYRGSHKVDVRIYIVDNNRKELDFKSKNSKNDLQILNEIKEAFKDNAKTISFIKSFYKILDDYQLKDKIHNPKQRQENMRMAAQKIIELFELKSDVVDIFDKELNIFYSSKNQLYILAKDQTSYRLGYDLEDLKSFE